MTKYENLKPLILRIISEAYSNYRIRRENNLGGSEPTMTVAMLREELTENYCHEIRREIPRRQTSLIRSALNSLTNEGSLVVSYGVSPHTGREVMMWEPNPGPSGPLRCNYENNEQTEM